ncbi:31314_t:CDS:1, partial [Racocetra persica]
KHNETHLEACSSYNATDFDENRNSEYSENIYKLGELSNDALIVLMSETS